MRNISLIVLIFLIFSACQGEEEQEYVTDVDWESKYSTVTDYDNYVRGKTYLPVYSHIYHRYKNLKIDLTITISIRNISSIDTIYILDADYFNTDGNKIRRYLKKPVFLKPMETIEIIIEEEDREGGSGANFVFDWAKKIDNNLPLFEAVMISTIGPQGLSFSTRGVPVTE